MKTFEIVADPSLGGERLDVALSKAGIGLSRRKIRAIIDVGGVFVNKKRVRIASRQVEPGDEISVHYNPEAQEKARQTTIALAAADILFTDDQVVAINKPPGLPSQATRDQSVFHAETAVRAYFKSEGEVPRQLILVHRLDKETSGVLLFATTGSRATLLTDQFRERSMRKRYLALVYGVPSKPEFEIRNYLSPIDKKTGSVRAVRSGGKPAATRFRVLATDLESQLALIECWPETGRSHQIRVHLESAGHPIVGDKKYGGQRSLTEALARLASHHHFLHAESIEFRLTGGGTKRIRAPLPPLFREFLANTSLANWLETSEAKN